MVKLKKILSSTLIITITGIGFNVATAANFTLEQLVFMPATMQIELYKKDIISPVDVVEAQIAQFKLTNEKVNAVTYTHFAKARKQAKKAKQRYKEGSYRQLEGITVGVKDEHFDKGWKITMGSQIHKNDPPQDHADPIVEKLKAAGAILLLQTTVPELYLNFTTSTKAWGTTKNPWDLKYTVGGSSGGSGAALAAGYVTLATGSDMGGSIRIPSSVCGLYGYKPAFGEIHTDLPFSSFSGSGPMARTFEDMVLMQNVISGPNKYSVNVGEVSKLPMQYPNLQGMKIAYVKGMGIIEPSSDVKVAMANAIKVLQEQGAVVETVNLDLGMTPDDISEDFSNVALSGAMGGMLSGYADNTNDMTNYAAYFVNKANTGNYNNKKLFAAEEKTKSLYKNMVDNVFANGYDVMIAPTMPTTHIPADNDFTQDIVIDDGVEYPALVGGLYTVPFNMLNWMPVINVPAGLSSENVPIGMQIIGKPHDTSTVFKVGYNYSKSGPKLFTGELMPSGIDI